MAEGTPLALGRAAAIEAIGEWLTGELRAKPLSASELIRWPNRDLVCGWGLSDKVLDRTISLSVMLDARFPRSHPIVAWVDAPAFPSIPHVEEDGVLCTLTEMDELDPTQPLGVVKNVIRRAGTIIADGLGGKNLGDFQREFLSYWNPTAIGQDVFSILDPSGPSRKIAIWRGKEWSVLGENSKSLQTWLSNRFRKKDANSFRTDPAFLLWLNAPLLPSHYPSSASDLEAVARSGDEKAPSVFGQCIRQEARAVTVAIGAPVDQGTCFAAIELAQPRSGHRNTAATSKGFRKGKVPPELLAKRHASDQLRRQRVYRADPFWIHGRDSNEDLITLIPSKVVLIGCGSLGSPVARFLAQAGVGHLHLVDGEQMELANVGRHALGVDAVGQRKSEALAARLSSEFPHAKFTSNSERWQRLVRDKPEMLTRTDLIVSTIGSWGHEGELNEWLSSQGWPSPCLFAWSEPNAVAGHAVLIGKESGCFACGLNQFGEYLSPIIEFSKPTQRPTPACGGFFQPYGASGISAIAGMSAEMAIGYLCERIDVGQHHMTAASDDAVNGAAGSVSENWLSLSGGKSFAATDWAARSDCAICGGKGV
jgi:sulfur-carrier protein adenylyltransferase/sulfurtransferase